MATRYKVVDYYDDTNESAPQRCFYMQYEQGLPKTDCHVNAKNVSELPHSHCVESHQKTPVICVPPALPIKSTKRAPAPEACKPPSQPPCLQAQSARIPPMPDFHDIVPQMVKPQHHGHAQPATQTKTEIIVPCYRYDNGKIVSKLPRCAFRRDGVQDQHYNSNGVKYLSRCPEDIKISLEC